MNTVKPSVPGPNPLSLKLLLKLESLCIDQVPADMFKVGCIIYYF